MPRCYIAGPMSGKPLYNFPAFENVANRWRDWGWHATSPHELHHSLWLYKYGKKFDPAVDKCDWGDPLMKEMFQRDLDAICKSDAIVLMDGWENSKGAKLELSVARALNLEVYLELGEKMNDELLDGRLKSPGIGTETILQEAQRLVHGNRQALYGHPIEDYTRTGRIWGAILGIPDIDPRIACLMMAAVKISREVNKPKRDNRVDLAGYAECADMVAEKQGV